MTGVVSGPDPGGDGDVVDAASLKDLGGGVSEVGADDDCFFFCGWGALHNFVYVDFGRDAALYRGSGQMCDSDVEVVKRRDSVCGSGQMA